MAVWLAAYQSPTLSGFRSENKDALGSVFVQVVGVLSAEGLITMERVTLDGTKIKANASGNTFRRKERIEAHLAEAKIQLDKMNEQAAEEEKVAKRQGQHNGGQRGNGSADWKARFVRWNGCSRKRERSRRLM